MVIGRLKTRTSSGRHGNLLVEVAVAVSILATVLIPLSLSHWHEQTLCRAYYQRAVAMEIVDGELEALAAGRWRAFKQGMQEYSVRAHSASNLPPGQFILTVQGSRIRLEWVPKAKDQGGRVMREADCRRE